MIKNFRFIFILLVVSVNAYAQDSISVSNVLQNNLSPVTRFSSVASYNPGAMVYTLHTNLTDLSAGYEKQTGDAGLLQAGTAFDDYAFRAESYMRSGKHHIWGKASYMKKHTDNIRWNESSDYFTIYPYVTADSVGGNNMVGEKYSFMGGYAQNMGKISWGVQLDYWALMEYRSRDPRPDNNTSNFVFTTGLNYRITDNYAIGGGLLLRKYKQKNTLSFKSVLGRPFIHYMTGLGMDATLFWDKNPGSLFDGGGYGANLQILPLSGMGVSGTLAYENFSFDKQLSTTQNLVISSIDENKYTLDIDYLKQINKNIIGLKIDASYTDRQGEEGKFTSAGNETYDRISEEIQYKNKITSANLTFIYQHNGVNTTWYAKPYLSYFNMEESHKSSSRKMEISKLGFGVKPGLSKSVKRHLLHIDANLGYSKNLDSNLELTGLSPERSITQTLQANYDYLSSDGFIAGLSARFDYSLQGKNMTIYLQGYWNYEKYDEVDSNLLGAKLGVAF